MPGLIQFAGPTCRCGHERGEHYFGTECQHGVGPLDACDCAHFLSFNADDATGADVTRVSVTRASGAIENYRRWDDG